MQGRRVWARFARADRGATAVEYGLLVAGVAIVVIPAVAFLSSASSDSFQTTIASEDGVTVCAEGDPNCTAFDALPAANLPGVPVVTTLAATAIGATGATLNGTVNANGTSTATSFCIGTAADLTGCTVVTGTPATATGNTATSVSAVRTGLATSTTYYYRVIGTSSKGTRYGATLSFVTGSAGSTAPTATTVAATGVGSTAATLNGFVVPGGLSTNVTFCFGTQSNLNSCTSTPASPATVTGTSGTAVSAALTGLQANRTYYFRVSAANGLGSDTGNRLSFTTGAAVVPPVAVTAAANPVGATTATFRGTVSGNRDDDGTLAFCYGTTAALADACAQSIPAGTYRKNDSGQAVSANVTGLTPALTYYVRLVATNDGNGVQGRGDLLTFTTGQATQTISFIGPASPNELTATETLVGTATSGLAVTFGVTTPTVCSLTGTTLTYLSVGTCTVTANQAGNAAYAAAPQVTRTVTVTKRSQTVSFPAPASPRVINDTAAVSASSNSGLPVALAASPSGTCTLSSGTVTYRAAGTCTITATQTGNATWEAASATRTVVVTKRPQTITFSLPASAPDGAKLDLSGSATSLLPVSYDAAPSSVCQIKSGKLELKKKGSVCTVTASQTGDTTWDAAPDVVLQVEVT